MLSEGLSRLSPRSAQQRFLTAKPRFTAAELRYLTEVDMRDHVAYVAIDDGWLIGVARLVRDPARPEHAEVAVTVGDPWQGRGIGTLLGSVLAAAARERGVRFLTATMAAENAAAHRLFAHISKSLHVEHHGSVDELVADLAA